MPIQPDESEPWHLVADEHQSADNSVRRGSAESADRDLWSDGLTPASDGNAWICGDCDQARNVESFDL